MQKINQVVDRINTRQPSSGSNPGRIDNARLKRIFAIMQTTYGSLWVDKVGTKELLSIAFDRWGKKLYGLTDDQIAKGLDNLPDDFPPTEGKFRKLCEGVSQGLTTNTAAYKPVPSMKGLPYKRSEQAKATGKQALEEARKILSGK